MPLGVNITLEGPIPIESRSAVCSSHHHFAVCTPRLIYLIAPNTSTSLKRHFLHTFVTFDNIGNNLIPPTKIEKGWMTTIHAQDGFRSAIWVPDSQNPVSEQLIILTYSGRLLFLKNDHNIGFSKGWKFAPLPTIIGKTVNHLAISCIESFDNFLFCGLFDGRVVRLDLDDHTFIDSLPPFQDSVATIFPTLNSVCFVTACTGKIYKADFSSHQTILIHDDGILQPGPSLRILHSAKNLSIMSKYNRLYCIEDSGYVHVFTMTSNSTTISAVESGGGSKLLVGMCDASWFEIELSIHDIKDRLGAQIKPKINFGRMNLEASRSEEFDEFGKNEEMISEYLYSKFTLLGASRCNQVALQMIISYDPSGEDLKPRLICTYSNGNNQPGLYRLDTNKSKISLEGAHPSACTSCGSILSKNVKNVLTCELGHFYNNK